MSPRGPASSTRQERPSVSSAATCTRARLSMNQRGAGGMITSETEFIRARDPNLRFRALSSDRLTPFSYCVLALVGQGGAGPHDLARMMRQQGGLYWSAAESQWYAEPK